MGKGKGEDVFLKEKQELALNNGHIECRLAGPLHRMGEIFITLITMGTGALRS